MYYIIVLKYCIKLLYQLIYIENKMFNNIFKFGKNRKNNKNNKNIIIGLLILVIGIFLTTNILKNTSLLKFREGNSVQNHMENDDVYIDCNPVDSEGVELVTVPQDPNNSSGPNTTNHIAKLLEDSTLYTFCR